MLAVQGKAGDAKKFMPFVPIEILYEFDGPRIFVIRDLDDALDLVCWSDEDDRASRYVVVPTSREILGDLRAGVLGVFDALNQPHCWLCDVDLEGNPVRCRLVDFEAIPRDALPAQGTMLLPTLGEAGSSAPSPRMFSTGKNV